jgi:spore maturation protein CgeB
MARRWPVRDIGLLHLRAECGRHTAQQQGSAVLPVEHLDLMPLDLSAEVRKHYRAEVSFIGTWRPERGPFMVELIRRGAPFSIWGDGCQKAPEWSVIASY